VVEQCIIEMFKRCHITPEMDSVVASIPETQSFMRVIEIPVMAESEIGEAVQWEVSQHIPFGLENVYIDWQPLLKGHTPSRGRQEVLVGAAQRKVVDPLLATLQALSVDSAAFELESQAIVRALVSPELAEQQGLLVVDLGAVATNIVIHDHGTMRFTASLQKGAMNLISVLSRPEQESVTGAPHELEGQQLALAEKLVAAEEETVMEIKGIVEFYNSIDAQHEVREIVLTGGGANLPGLDQAFLRYFDNVRVQRGNPWVNVRGHSRQVLPPLTVYESVHFSTALGLALRPVIR
jgi:type IV pilus assembly protein PilM